MMNGEMIALRRNVIRFSTAMLTLVSMAWAQDLPSGDSLMDQSSKASGGEEVVEKLENMVMRGTMSIQNMSLEGTLAMYMARPNRAYAVFELPGLEKLERGWNGEVGWEKSIMQGPRLLSGSELASFVRDVDFEAQLDWRKLYKSATTTGEESVDGQACFVVVLVTHTDDEMTLKLDKGTFLPAAMSMMTETPYGEIQADIRFKDYKSYRGMMMPATTVTSAAGQEMTLKISSVKFNEEIPEDLFALPADVQALVDAAPAETP